MHHFLTLFSIFYSKGKRFGIVMDFFFLYCSLFISKLCLLFVLEFNSENSISIQIENNKYVYFNYTLNYIIVYFT